MAIRKHKVRIGLYTTGLKAYWPQFAGMRERLEGYGRFIAAELAATGGASFDVEVFNFGLVDCADSGLEAGDYFRRNLCDMNWNVRILSMDRAINPTVAPPRIR